MSGVFLVMKRVLCLVIFGDEKGVMSGVFLVMSGQPCSSLPFLSHCDDWKAVCSQYVIKCISFFTFIFFM